MGELRARTAASLVMVVAMAATACAAGSKRPEAVDSAHTQTAAPAQRTAWSQVLHEIGPEGGITRDTALRAFALAFGPLPGVSVPAGEVGTIRSGSGAVRWLLRYWDEITAAQRAAATRLVPELGASDGVTASPAAFRKDGPSASPTHPPAYYLEIAKSKAVLITAALGGAPRLTLDLDVREGAVQRVTSAAETVVRGPQGVRTGVASTCIIRISPGGSAQDPDVIENMMAHEIWHCFQGQLLGIEAYETYPDWNIEGGAEWVGNTIAPTANPDVGAWNDYVHYVGKRLFARSYDAIGFFSHLDQAKLDTWSRLIPMLTNGADNAAAFMAAGASSDEFLDTWASGYFREPTYGKAWDLTGPSLPPQPADVPVKMAVDDGAVADLAAPQYANSIVALSSNADVLVFSVDGHVRLGDPATKQEYVVRGTSAFCTKSGGCECPPGSSYAGVPPTRLSADSVLGVSSGSVVTSGTVSGESLSELCKASGSGAAWHFDSPSRYSGGASHTVVDAYTCSTAQGPWKATLHVTHDSATPGDPPLDRVVDFTWTFDRSGHASPTIGPYADTVFGRKHRITYFPVVQLDANARTITVVSMQGSEDGGPRIDVGYQLGRLGDAVPLSTEKPAKC